MKKTGRLEGEKEKSAYIAASFTFHLTSDRTPKQETFQGVRNNHLGYHDKTQKLDG